MIYDDLPYMLKGVMPHTSSLVAVVHKTNVTDMPLIPYPVLPSLEIWFQNLSYYKYHSTESIQ